MTNTVPRHIQRHVIEDLLGTPYAEMNCFDLVRTVFQRDAGVCLPSSQEEMAALFGEVWFVGTGVEIHQVVRPYDVVLLATRQHGIGTHIGLMVNESTFLHTRERLGVCQEPLQRWASRLVQILRYRAELP